MSAEVVLQQGTLAVTRLRSDFSQSLFGPSTEVPELVPEVIWSALTPVEKTGAHRGNRGRLKCPLGVSVSPSVDDTRARVGEAAQPIHQFDVAAAAEEQHLASTIPCLQWPFPDYSSCTGSGTGLIPWKTSSAHETSSKWVFFSPLCSFEAIRMSWHDRSDGSRMGQRWELVHSFCFSKLLS